ncbi:hypothetical protein [Anaerotignum propionicum]|uniref:hypothetical protein n=1 Tax=Anaerotignum propionicum TaxID=28446 RepID=UPI00210C6268|nr:hypothetical protein [Anaerotignum propionicum]MCQ4936344.1 hypothetical protein [Anaerotignum propionicum]
MNDYIGKIISANYFRGAEAVGGKVAFGETGLTIKSTHLIFSEEKLILNMQILLV